MKIYKDSNKNWRIGATINPGICWFTINGDKVRIFTQSNNKYYYNDKIINIQFKNLNGNFENCIDVEDFKDKVRKIDILSDLDDSNFKIANY